MDEQQDPRGVDGAHDDEPAFDQPSAREREEVDEDIPTIDPGRTGTRSNVPSGSASPV